MKSLFDYEFLVNEVFYRCQPILKWIEDNKNLSELDKEAIQATIMDALVYKKLIDPTKESLDLEHLCIVDNLEHYVYNEHPNVCGIPQWMKEEFRKKCIKITAGIPISLYLSKPPSKYVRYCVYDRNVAVSAIFPDANFYDVYYTSPTRNKPIEKPRPFIEVEINNEQYLVDVLTKRIFKSSYFKEKYGFRINKESKLSEITKDKEKLQIYQDFITDEKGLSIIIPFLLIELENQDLSMAEMQYELEKSKQYHPKEWDKYEHEKIEMENFFRLSKNKN